MDVQKILKKLVEAKPKGMSPDEVELNSYLAEEERDRIKQILGKYREKKAKEILLGNTLVSGKKGVLDAEDVITKSHNSLISNKILHNKNLFFT